MAKGLLHVGMECWPDEVSPNAVRSKLTHDDRSEIRNVASEINAARDAALGALLEILGRSVGSRAACDRVGFLGR